LQFAFLFALRLHHSIAIIQKSFDQLKYQYNLANLGEFLPEEREFPSHWRQMCPVADKPIDAAFLLNPLQFQHSHGLGESYQ